MNNKILKKLVSYFLISAVFLPSYVCTAVGPTDSANAPQKPIARRIVPKRQLVRSVPQEAPSPPPYPSESLLTTALKILEKHGYSRERDSMEARCYSNSNSYSNNNAEKDTRKLDDKYSPMVLDDDEFRYVINNFPGEVVYRGVYSGKGKYLERGETRGRIIYDTVKQKQPPIDLGKYCQDLFKLGVISSESPLAKGDRCKGGGLYFFTSLCEAFRHAIGREDRWYAAYYGGGLLIEGFLINTSKARSEDNIFCVQSNNRLVLRATPFALDSDVDKPRSQIDLLGDLISCRGNEPILRKYLQKLQEWNILKQEPN